MPKFIDLTGRVFGDLTVVQQTRNIHGRIRWKCICRCGKNIVASSHELLHGLRTHCRACGPRSQRPREDLTGRTFGQLTVLRYVGASRWLCRCSCGNEVTRVSYWLRNKENVNCGCMRKATVQRPFYKDLTGKMINGFIVKCFDYTAHKWVCVCPLCGQETLITNKSYMLLHKGCACAMRHAGPTIDLTGQRFGRLTVKKYVGRSRWQCLCDCGQETIVSTGKLRSRYTRSCGCLRSYSKGSLPERFINQTFLEQSSVKTQMHAHIFPQQRWEVDVFVPSCSLAVEYNGSAFHASSGNVFQNKSPAAHLEKCIAANDNNVHLITIFEIDWIDHRQIILNYLLSLLDKRHFRLTKVTFMSFVEGCKLIRGTSPCAFNKGGVGKEQRVLALHSKDNLFAVAHVEFSKRQTMTILNFAVCTGSWEFAIKQLLNYVALQWPRHTIRVIVDRDYINIRWFTSLGFHQIDHTLSDYFWSGGRAVDAKSAEKRASRNQRVFHVYRCGLSIVERLPKER